VTYLLDRQSGLGNETDAEGLRWIPMPKLLQLEDGRLTYTLTDLLSDDNNVYLLNIMIENSRTGEKASLRTHTIQRRTPVYDPPVLTPSPPPPREEPHLTFCRFL
jgi:hypothetical protein